jgi:hypothetical protein
MMSLSHSTLLKHKHDPSSKRKFIQVTFGSTSCYHISREGSEVRTKYVQLFGMTDEWQEKVYQNAFNWQRRYKFSSRGKTILHCIMQSLPVLKSLVTN